MFHSPSVTLGIDFRLRSLVETRQPPIEIFLTASGAVSSKFTEALSPPARLVSQPMIWHWFRKPSAGDSQGHRNAYFALGLDE